MKSIIKGQIDSRIDANISQDDTLTKYKCPVCGFAYKDLDDAINCCKYITKFK
jgi:predicted RNA-binding Zn-ribbon protein involved in translation (DUF1610 family)